MRIRRIRMVLPARLKASAAHDARLIANAVAEQLAASKSGQRRVTVSSDGAPAQALAAKAAGQIGPGPKAGG